MTRRTDWGEYAYPSAPESRGRGGTGGRAVEEFGPYAGDADEGDVAGPPQEVGPSGGGASRDGRGRAGGGRVGGGRGGGASPDAAGGTRGRGGRRRGFGEPAGEPYDDGGSQDGGSSFSSRAEKGESSGDPAERARAICLRLLTGTPRTRRQLADALRKREIPDDVADEVLSRFEEVGLINDSAFADAWVESRHHGRGLARRALARELRTKGVDSALIDEAVAQLDSDQEEATARELVARKLRSTRGLDRDKRLRRLAGMLARKGYPEGMALRVVRQALEEEGEDTDGLEEGY
ncbi:recombination regulator RecX [Streptomyces heilongjiangensis]|uniref:Regulatory protein RecX n=1 Tax=Streptomyces heilongjiangensis TaxID=945052 RepID=A0ABW1BBH5_9ACTN|nr:recombination regulator RecX [Streptomyces heilongjiangensis]MDC2948941.1 recombination regulator RecX [Streptomyces heilongjiangensis]